MTDDAPTDGTDASAGEVERKAVLGEVYARYHDPTYARRWSLDNAGNAANEERLDRDLRALLDGRFDAAPPVVLDLGSGASPAMRPALQELADRGWRIGADLLHERLMVAATAGSTARSITADGARLPLRDASCDLVALFTVLSSVVEPDIEAAVAAEATRVLRPGGVVVVYDMRVPSPRNPNVHPVPARRLRRLFPGLALDARSTTLLPPLARRLGRLTPGAFTPLCALPFLRSHVLAVLEKPR